MRVRWELMWELMGSRSRGCTCRVAASQHCSRHDGDNQHTALSPAARASVTGLTVICRFMLASPSGRSVRLGTAG